MMVCIHAAVGAGLGGLVGRRRAALAGGIVSHLLCDLLPHRDYDIKIEAPLAMAMFAYLVRRYGVQSPQFWGAVGAVAPDAENALSLFGLFPEEKKLFPSHNESASWFLGHGRKLDSPASQIILAALALALAERSRN